MPIDIAWDKSSFENRSLGKKAGPPHSRDLVVFARGWAARPASCIEPLHAVKRVNNDPRICKREKKKGD